MCLEEVMEIRVKEKIKERVEGVEKVSGRWVRQIMKKGYLVEK